MCFGGSWHKFVFCFAYLNFIFFDRKEFDAIFFGTTMDYNLNVLFQRK